MRLSVCLALLAATLRPQSYDFAEADRILTTAQQELNVPISITLTQSGRTVFQKTYGITTVNQPYAIASASKWLSAAVVMSVVDEGRLSLDDKISQYLPYFTGDKANMTIRQAFSHTAGFPAESALSGETPCLNDRTTTLDACARAIAQIPLTSAPGTQFAYGSLSIQVTGRVLEGATGRPFAQLFRERLANPLGLTSTLAALPGRDANPLVAGGYASSNADYTRFLTMILNRGVFEGRRVLSAASVIEMQKDQTGGATIFSSPYQFFETLRPGVGQTRYGIGEWLERTEAGSAREVGSQGAFAFSPWVDLDRNLTGVVALQDRLQNFEPYYFPFREAIRRAVPVANLTSRGVVNAASFAMGPLVPGELITLFGSNLGPPSLVQAPSISLPLELAGTKVLLDGVAVPILYTSAGQVTALVPRQTLGKTSLQVEVEYLSQKSGSVVLPVEDAAPGIFAGIADRGVAVLWGTGAPLDHRGLQVTIGGRPAPVLYAGPAPGLVEGVFQLNASIPPGSDSTSEVVVRYGNIASPPVRLLN